MGGKRIDASDIVQQTVLDAHKDRERFRGKTEPERFAWLRRLLACNLADLVRAQGRAKRDEARVRSLEQVVGDSSARLEQWLAADQSSPSGAPSHEMVVRLADALARLPEDSRQAIVMRHCQGLSLNEITLPSDARRRPSPAY